LGTTNAWVPTAHAGLTHHQLGFWPGRTGLYFRWWDKMMGTEHPDYRARFESFAAPGARVAEAD